MSALHGWTTWDPASIAVWEHLPSGVRCRLVLQDSAGQQVQPGGWVPVEDYLPDDQGHSLAHLLFISGDAQVDVECGGEGDVAACHINQVTGSNVSAHWEVENVHDGWQVEITESDVRLAPAGTAVPDDIAAFLRDQHDVAQRAMPHGEGLLAEPLAAVDAAIAANTVELPQTREIVTLSRHRVEAEGAWTLPNWETFLTALGIAYADPALALANCRAALRHLAIDGMLGAEARTDGVRTDFSSPPVAAYCLWKIFQLTNDASLLEEAYPLLLHWHDWWLNARDGNLSRLLDWKTAEETGMPEHPLYRTAATDERTGVLRLDDVGLNSLWALDAFALMRIALSRDDLDRATHLEEEIRGLADRMNLALWDHALGIFRSRDWDDFFAAPTSLTGLLTFAGGIPTRIRAQRMVDEHLAQEFNTPFLLPTVADTDPAFAEQQRWRGRISPLLNLLICEGLRHFGDDAWAERITLSGLELLSRSWRDGRRVFDSYNARTGQGDDMAQDPMAPAGLLFGTLGIAMLADMEPWDGMRLGNLSGVEMAAHGIPLRGDRYDLASGPWGFTARRNGKLWLEMDRPAILRNLQQTEHEVILHAKLPAGGQLRLRIHGYAPKQAVSLKVNSRVWSEVVSAAGVIERTVDIPPPPAGGAGLGMATNNPLG